ncbi:MAG: hypothetical protein N4A49_08225 [Marinifilaceae bacterium]|jgi:hypothetical protein|nr:hypothetical protein [Marinifilaceae bacterium]
MESNQYRQGRHQGLRQGRHQVLSEQKIKQLKEVLQYDKNLKGLFKNVEQTNKKVGCMGPPNSPREQDPDEKGVIAAHNTISDFSNAPSVNQAQASQSGNDPYLINSNKILDRRNGFYIPKKK